MLSSAISDKQLIKVNVSKACDKQGRKQKTDSNQFKNLLNISTKTDNLTAQDNTSKKTEKNTKLEAFAEKHSASVSENRIDTFSKTQNQEKQHTDELKENVEDLINNIITLIMDATNKSLDDVTDVMNNLNLNYQDLTNNKNISEMFAKLTGFDDAMNLLTNKDLSASIKDILEEINVQKLNLMSEFQLNDSQLKDEINEIFSKKDITNSSSTKDVLELMEEHQNQTEISNRNIKDTKEFNGSYEDYGEDLQVINDDSKDLSYSQSDTQSNTNDLLDSKVEQKVQETEVKKESHETIAFTNVVDNIREVITKKITTQFGSDISAKIVNQIIDEIKISAKPNMTSLQIQLEPETLGKVTLTVATTKAGILTASLVAQNETAKAAIESQLSVLKENLENQGVKVDAIEVTVASKGFEQSLDQDNASGEKKNQKNHRRISKEDLAMINGDYLEETKSEDVIKELGNTVSYLA